jgi:hypothetical protein
VSVKVEIDLLDAKLLSLLEKSKASACMSWDTNIREDVRIKVELTYPIGSQVPTTAIDEINSCITDCVTAFGDTSNGT